MASFTLHVLQANSYGTRCVSNFSTADRDAFWLPTDGVVWVHAPTPGAFQTVIVSDVVAAHHWQLLSDLAFRGVHPNSQQKEPNDVSPSSSRLQLQAHPRRHLAGRLLQGD
jgi:hypothetical protein